MEDGTNLWLAARYAGQRDTRRTVPYNYRRARFVRNTTELCARHLSRRWIQCSKSTQFINSKFANTCEKACDTLGLKSVHDPNHILHLAVRETIGKNDASKQSLTQRQLELEHPKIAQIRELVRDVRTVCRHVGRSGLVQRVILKVQKRSGRPQLKCNHVSVHARRLSQMRTGYGCEMEYNFRYDCTIL